MKPDISEFSYGFALTNELVGWLPLKAAPIFPSLIEEGKVGGGYDVKFELSAVPLFLQFKRAEYMKHSSANPLKAININYPHFKPPFFRFALMEVSHSIQHELLIDLETESHLVFYAAPRFYLPNQINEHWANGEIVDNSIFIRPRDIGIVLDERRHYVAYDTHDTFFCSEPKKIECVNGLELLKLLMTHLAAEKRTLRTVIDDSLEVCHTVQRRVQADKSLLGDGVAEGLPRYSRERIPIRPPRALDRDRLMLRALADVAIRDFNSQLVIIQSD